MGQNENVKLEKMLGMKIGDWLDVCSEVDVLRAENAKLREALAALENDATEYLGQVENTANPFSLGRAETYQLVRQQAREALSGEVKK